MSNDEQRKFSSELSDMQINLDESHKVLFHACFRLQALGFFGAMLKSSIVVSEKEI